MNKELTWLDILTILSYLIGVQNLNLNEKQVNDLDQHLQEQDDILIKQQNSMLKKIIEQNETIINLLKGEAK